MPISLIPSLSLSKFLPLTFCLSLTLSLVISFHLSPFLPFLFNVFSLERSIFLSLFIFLRLCLSFLLFYYFPILFVQLTHYFFSSLTLSLCLNSLYVVLLIASLYVSHFFYLCILLSLIFSLLFTFSDSLFVLSLFFPTLYLPVSLSRSHSQYLSLSLWSFFIYHFFSVCPPFFSPSLSHSFCVSLHWF